MINDDNYNIKVTYDDSTSGLMYANRLHNENLDYWKGWQCSAGSTGIYIYESDVYGGECLNDYLGKLGEEWDIIDGYTTCRLDRCTGCTTDLSREKFTKS